MSQSQLPREDFQARREATRLEHYPHIHHTRHTFQIPISERDRTLIKCEMNDWHMPYFFSNDRQADLMREIQAIYAKSADCRSEKPLYCWVEHEHRDRFKILHHNTNPNAEPAASVNGKSFWVWFAISFEKLRDKEVVDFEEIQLTR